MRRLSPWDHFYRRILPAYWVFLFCVTHFPKLRLPGGVPQSDKIVHFVAFGLLASLLWKLGETFRRPVSVRFKSWALVVLIAYAAFDELTQPLVNRTGAVDDFRANVVGVIAAFGLMTAWSVRRERLEARARAL